MTGWKIRSSAFLLTAAFYVLLGGPGTPALADPAESLGLGFDGRSGAGAAAASVAEEWSAVFYNPANLGFARQPGASVSTLMLFSQLDPDSAKTPEGAFAEAGLLLPVWPFSSLPVNLGVGVLMPASGFYEIDVYPVDTPTYGLYNSRDRRLSLSLGLGAQLTSWLAIGASVQMLPHVLADVDLDLADALGPNTLRVHVEYRLNPIVGVTFAPLDNLRLGLVWRGANHTGLDLPVKVDAEGINLEARIQAATYFVPHRVTLGASWLPMSDLFAEIDLSWHHFSQMPHPSAEVALWGSDGQDTLQTQPPDSMAQDVVSAALAAGWDGPVQLRLGYRFFPNPFEEATQRANLLSGNEHLVTLGARIPLAVRRTNQIPVGDTLGQEASRAPDAGFWLTGTLFGAYISENHQYKEEFLPDNPGFPSIQSGGFRYGFSVGVEARY